MDPGVRPSTSAAQRILRGAQLGRYLLGRRLGSGAMGVVHTATDLLLRRTVAIKVLHSELGSDVYHRLAQEAHALARLSDPHVVQIFDVGIAFDLAYIVMEWVDGVDLRRRWSACHDAYSRLALVIEAGLGLAAAHRAGVVHGDFKPDNVLCGVAGSIKVADFGLARVLAPAHTPVTDAERPAWTGGTPNYMAPELHQGQPVDERSDQYAFCATAYEAIVGTPPFRGGDLDALTDAKWRGVARPTAPGVSRRVTAAVLRGLEPDCLQRWPTMRELLAAMAPRTRLRWAWPAGAIMGVGAFALLEPTPTRCDPDELPGSAESPDAVADADRRWREAWREACDASDHDHLACLTQRRAELHALAEGLRDGPGRDPVPDEALPADLLCERGITEGRTVEVALALARGRGLRLAGHHAHARAQALAAERLAVAELDIAAVDLELGHLAFGESDLDAARTKFESAYHRAMAVGDHELGAHAALAVASMLSSEPTAAAQTWLAHATAAIERAGASADLEARLAALQCRFAAERAGLAEATPTCGHALDLAAALGDGELVESALSLLGVANARKRRYAESLSIFERELALREARLGAGHPLNIGILLNIAASMQAGGDPLAASAVLDRASELVMAHGGDRHREYVRIELSRGAVAAQLDRDEEALTHTQAALDAIELRDVESRVRVTAMYNHGIALQDLDRNAEAEAMAWRAFAWATDHLEADDPANARLIDLAGDTWSARGDYPRALALHRRASAIARRRLPAWDVIRGELDLGVGNDLVELGRHAEALEVLGDARAGLESGQADTLPALVAALELIGRARIALGRPCAAAIDLERAHLVANDDPEVMFSLARAIAACGDEHNRAHALARAARARTGPSQVKLAEAIDDWLRAPP